MALTVVNIGNNAGTRGVPTDMANAIEIYSGMVLTAFERKTLFLNLVTTKTISAGSSMSFPIIGQASDSDVDTHVPGTALSMNTIPVKERIINIDALEYYAMAVDKFEEKVLHFETRNELAKQAGEALAVKIDKAVAKQIVIASQTSGTIGSDAVQADGTEVVYDVIDTGSTPKAKGDALIEAVFTAVAAMEEKDITGEKYLVVSPLVYSYLAQSDAINKDVTSGNNGGLDTGLVMDVAGIKIYKSNYIPSELVSVGASDITTLAYQDGDTGSTAAGQYSAPIRALLFTSECVGVVKLMDVTSESNYIPEQLATLLTSYYSYGMGVLKPGAACVICGNPVDATGTSILVGSNSTDTTTNPVTGS